MKQFVVTVVCFSLLLAGCAIDDSPAPKTDVTLEPSQIAANVLPVSDEDAIEEDDTESNRVNLSAGRATLAPTDAPRVTPTLSVPTFTPLPNTPDTSATTEPTNISTQPTQPAESEVTPQAVAQEPSLPAPTPTSIADELRAQTTNPTLLVAARFETNCFLEGEPIPFTLEATNLDTSAIYFYPKGLWQVSINNNPPGPQLASRPPNLREDFTELQPNETFAQAEEDIGLWALSLGPQAPIPPSPTGLGLPAGDYWVTFLYNNDQDGLTEQFGGTFLIERAAWTGITVASEVRFRVVDNLDNC